jgi:copper chaperone
MNFAFDLPAIGRCMLLLSNDADYPRRIQMLKFTVPDMSCGHCVGIITKAVKSVDTDATVTVDLTAKTVAIETGEEATSISKAIEAAGYPNQTAG